MYISITLGRARPLELQTDRRMASLDTSPPPLMVNPSHASPSSCTTMFTGQPFILLLFSTPYPSRFPLSSFSYYWGGSPMTASMASRSPTAIELHFITPG